jgi:plastocyanin
MRASVLVAALVATACGGSSYDDDGGGGGCTVDTATATTSVQLVSNAFIPSCIRVAPSATVTFTNTDSMTHTVTTDAGQPETFDSGILAPAATYTHTFAASPETVRIHCELHPMRATVFVQ